MIDEGVAVRRFANGITQTILSDERYKPGEGLTGQAMIQSETGMVGQTVISNRAGDKTIPLVHADDYRHILRSGTVNHIAVVPIVGTGGTLGLLRVVNKCDPRDPTRLHPVGFDAADIGMLGLVAALVAHAVESVAHSRLITMLHRLYGLREDALHHNWQADDLMPRIEAIVRDVCGFDRVIVHVGPPRTDLPPSFVCISVTDVAQQQLATIVVEADEPGDIGALRMLADNIAHILQEHLVRTALNEHRTANILHIHQTRQPLSSAMQHIENLLRLGDRLRPEDLHTSLTEIQFT